MLLGAPARRDALRGLHGRGLSARAGRECLVHAKSGTRRAPRAQAARSSRARAAPLHATTRACAARSATTTALRELPSQPGEQGQGRKWRTHRTSPATIRRSACRCWKRRGAQVRQEFERAFRNSNLTPARQAPPPGPRENRQRAAAWCSTAAAATRQTRRAAISSRSRWRPHAASATAWSSSRR